MILILIARKLITMKQKQIAILAAVVYFIQGALGISAVALPIYFRSLGWSVAEITVISSLTSLPWILKVVYGFLSDSIPLFGLRRKSYLLVYLVCSFAGWISFALIGSHKTSVLVSLWIANLGFAGTDVITDGLIVENSDVAWGRIYQSIAWGFRSLGSVLTGILGGWLLLKLEPKAIFLITACLPLLAVPTMLLFREEPCRVSFSSEHLWVQAKSVGRFCCMRSNLVFILFLALSSSSVLFGTPFFFYMKEKLFFAEDYLGFLISLGWAGAAIGSVLFATRMKKISMRKLFCAVIVLNTLNILTTYAVRGVDSAAWLVFFGGIAGGMMILPLMTAAAVLTTQSGVEGTLFALLMGLFNLAQIMWGILGGKLLPILGLWQLIGLAALIQCAAYFLIPLMRGMTFDKVSAAAPGLPN